MRKDNELCLLDYVPFLKVNMTLYIEKQMTTLLLEEMTTNMVVDISVDMDMVKVKSNAFLSKKRYFHKKWENKHGSK